MKMRLLQGALPFPRLANLYFTSAAPADEYVCPMLVPRRQAADTGQAENHSGFLAVLSTFRWHEVTALFYRRLMG